MRRIVLLLQNVLFCMNHDSTRFLFEGGATCLVLRPNLAMKWTVYIWKHDPHLIASMWYIDLCLYHTQWWWSAQLHQGGILEDYPTSIKGNDFSFNEPTRVDFQSHDSRLSMSVCQVQRFREKSTEGRFTKQKHKVFRYFFRLVTWVSSIYIPCIAVSDFKGERPHVLLEICKKNITIFMSSIHFILFLASCQFFSPKKQQ